MGSIARTSRALFAGLVITVVSAVPAWAEDPAAVGTIEIDEHEIAFIGRASVGGGTLHFEGDDVRFRIAGLGAGGVGVSKISAEGEVFKLEKRSQFPGTYASSQIGLDIASMGGGHLWLKNEHGVVLKLKARIEGVELATGVEGVVITLE